MPTQYPALTHVPPASGLLCTTLINMINAILVFNNSGQPRLTKFYTQLDTITQQSLLSQIFTLVSARPSSACNFLPLPPLLAPSQASSSSSSSSSSDNDLPTQITYRHYATLYFIVISTSTESPLAVLDLIQVFVEALDRLFENVCELDLIFGFETLHAVLGEMVVGGVVVETGLESIVRGVRESEAGGGAGAGGGGVGSRGKRRGGVNEEMGMAGTVGRGMGVGAGGAMRALGWAGGGGLGSWR